MKICGKAGNYLMPDGKTLMPIYEAIQKQGRTLLAHVGRAERRMGVYTYPNFAVDVAARVPYLFKEDAKMIRQFLDKYQDRILYGSDHMIRDATDSSVAAFLATDERRSNMFVSSQRLARRNQQVQGISRFKERVRRRESCASCFTITRGA
jgi:hypothetical protein